MKKTILVIFAVGLAAICLTGCFSLGGSTEPAVKEPEKVSQPQSQPQEKGENQVKKFQRILTEDNEKLVIGSDNKATIESIEAVFQPQVVSSRDEITVAKLSEPGRPYYFKLRALYKGYDAKAKGARLQDLGAARSNVMDAALETVFGVDTNAYYVPYFDAVASTFPTEVNAIATFYLIAARFTEDDNGRTVNESSVWIRFIRNIEKPLFDPAKFIVVNGMHYITVEDTKIPSREEVMMNVFTGGATGNSSANVFDPVVYPLVDLMDARVAMDKKDRLNDYTFPTVRVKYVSEVLFKGQSGTTITVSTDDNVLTEKMTFTGRASAITNGEKVRVYYTIAKDPLEKWEIQAIERL